MIIKGPFTNIWGNPTIADNVQVGAYTEIGDDVTIAAGVIIGALCFIPPKVRIGERAWIGPRVTFTNDKNPPGPQVETIVEADVVIGAGAVILPGIVLGRGCRIGAGAVVTKSVMPGTTVVGNPARLLVKNREGIEAKLDAILQHSLETEKRLNDNWPQAATSILT